MDAERFVVRHCLKLVKLGFGTQGSNTRDERTLKGGLICGVGVEGESARLKGTAECTDRRWQDRSGWHWSRWRGRHGEGGERRMESVKKETILLN